MVKMVKADEQRKNEKKEKMLNKVNSRQKMNKRVSLIHKLYPMSLMTSLLY